MGRIPIHRIIILVAILSGFLPILGTNPAALQSTGNGCPNSGACVNGICAGSGQPTVVNGKIKTETYEGREWRGTQLWGWRALWEIGIQKLCPNGPSIYTEKYLSSYEWLISQSPLPPPGTPPTPTPSPGTNCSGYCTTGSANDTWPDINQYYEFIANSKNGWTKTDCADATAGCLTFIVEYVYEVVGFSQSGEPKLKEKARQGVHVAKVVSSGVVDHKPGGLPAATGVTITDVQKIYDGTLLGVDDAQVTTEPNGNRIKTGSTTGRKVGDQIKVIKTECFCP